MANHARGEICHCSRPAKSLNASFEACCCLHFSLSRDPWAKIAHCEKYSILARGNCKGNLLSSLTVCFYFDES